MAKRKRNILTKISDFLGLWKISDFFKSLSSWYRVEAKNPWYWKSIWYSIKRNKSWDYYYVYDLLYYKLNKDYYYYNKICKHIDTTEICKWIKISISLLEIILEKRDIYDVKFNDGDLGKSEIICKVKVNLKNVQRYKQRCFDPWKTKYVWNYEYMLVYPHELYIQKARVLFHEILKNYSETWWD